jgi:hypothetical protein
MTRPVHSLLIHITCLREVSYDELRFFPYCCATGEIFDWNVEGGSNKNSQDILRLDITDDQKKSAYQKRTLD